MTILKIRLLQIKRELVDLGVGIIVLLLLYVFAVYNCYLFFQEDKKALLLSLAFLLIYVSLQIGRKDKAFVLMHTKQPYKEFFFEYFVLGLPITSVCLFTKNWWLFLVITLCTFFVGYINLGFKRQTYFRNISAFIPAYYFEWISGIRKSFTLLIPFYLLAILSCFVRIVPLIFLWFVVVQIVSFFTENESTFILTANDESAKKFLSNKLNRHVSLLLKLIMPIAIINLIFNFSDWIVIVSFVIVLISLLCFAICFKYAGYVPNQNSTAKSITVSMIVLCSLIPYLFIVPFIFAVIYYRKALHNLNPYFND